MPDSASAPVVFRLAVVAGVTPDRWCRTWSSRQPDVPMELVRVEVAEQGAALLDARADAGLVRLPVDRDACDAIPLYTEATVVVAPRDHLITAADEVTLADLADEPLLLPVDDVLGWSTPPGRGVVDRPATSAAAVALVAAGVGVLVVPQSLARLHHRRDCAHRVVTDAPTSSVALAWVRDRHTDLVEEMIGIVRGRTPNSTRGQPPSPGSPAPAGGSGAPRGGAGQRAGAPRGGTTRGATARDGARPRRR